MNTRDYLIIIEPTKTGFSAYSPDLDGCITVGDTVEETRKNMAEAIEL
jgi:predicted RNase H-like HicB family nuclease